MIKKIETKKELDEFICHKWNEVNAFIDQLGHDLPIPIYSSVDIRESKTKYAPVDLNLFPAGFNNLCSLDLKKSGHRFIDFLVSIDPNIKNIAIIPESNTKNTFYLEHLHCLKKALQDGDYDVHFISLDQTLFEENRPLILKSSSDHEIIFHPAVIKDGKFLGTDGQALDLVLLNHDQSAPIEINWQEIKTPVHPSPYIGWFNREKSIHFKYYEEVLDQFCNHFNIEKNLLMAKFLRISDIDFASKEGLERLAEGVDRLKENLAPEAKVFIKANKGTYGMGISVVSSGEQAMQMNRKTRNKMDIGKNKIKFTSVLLQESIETILKYDDYPAEVTIYLIGGQSTGGFMRTNILRDAQSNLNAKGMVFQKFCISEIQQNQEHKCKEAVYSVVARLSTMAGAYEIKEALGAHS